LFIGDFGRSLSSVGVDLAGVYLVRVKWSGAKIRGAGVTSRSPRPCQWVRGQDTEASDRESCRRRPRLRASTTRFRSVTPPLVPSPRLPQPTKTVGSSPRRLWDDSFSLFIDVAIPCNLNWFQTTFSGYYVTFALHLATRTLVAANFCSRHVNVLQRGLFSVVFGIPLQNIFDILIILSCRFWHF